MDRDTSRLQVKHADGWIEISLRSKALCATHYVHVTHTHTHTNQSRLQVKHDRDSEYTRLVIHIVHVTIIEETHINVL
jgi:hypothetical protein